MSTVQVSGSDEARTWGVCFALCVLVGCTVCGSDSAQVAAGPASTSARAAESPCSDDENLNSKNQCVPNAWFCGPRFYNAGRADGCDCDCGVPDPDCAINGVVHWCYNLGHPRQTASCAACASVQAAQLLD